MGNHRHSTHGDGCRCPWPVSLPPHGRPGHGHCSAPTSGARRLTGWWYTSGRLLVSIAPGVLVGFRGLYPCLPERFTCIGGLEKHQWATSLFSTHPVLEWYR